MFNKKIIKLMDHYNNAQSEKERHALLQSIQQESAFEGQRTALKDMAQVKYYELLEQLNDKGHDIPENVQEVEKQTKKASDKLKGPMEGDGGSLHQKIFDLEDAFYEEMAEKEEWKYLEGFLAGYYLAQKAQGNAVPEKEKDHPAATGMAHQKNIG